MRNSFCCVTIIMNKSWELLESAFQTLMDPVCYRQQVNLPQTYFHQTSFGLFLFFFLIQACNVSYSSIRALIGSTIWSIFGG